MGEVGHARVEMVSERHHRCQSLKASIEFVHHVEVFYLLPFSFVSQTPTYGSTVNTPEHPNQGGDDKTCCKYHPKFTPELKVNYGNLFQEYRIFGILGMLWIDVVKYTKILCAKDGRLPGNPLHDYSPKRTFVTLPKLKSLQTFIWVNKETVCNRFIVLKTRSKYVESSELHSISC